MFRTLVSGCLTAVLALAAEMVHSQSWTGTANFFAKSERSKVNGTSWDGYDSSGVMGRRSAEVKQVNRHLTDLATRLAPPSP